MDLNTYCERIETAAELARKVGANPVEISNWRRLKRPVPEARCVAIEKATNGQVTRQELRPEDWASIWPELVKPKKKAS